MMRGVTLLVAGLIVAGAATPVAAQGKAAPRVAACPYTAAELGAALGFAVADGTPGREDAYPGGRMLHCRYEAKGSGTFLVTFNLLVMDDANSKDASYLKMMAGKMEPIPADPDGAMFQADQGDLTNATLHYLRRGVTVEARVWAGPKDPKFGVIRDKLAKLRRVP